MTLTLRTVGPKFCGVRDIPPARALYVPLLLAAGRAHTACTFVQGLHFVYASQAQGGAGVRTGAFVQIGAGDTHVFQWDASLEALVTSTSGATCRCLRLVLLSPESHMFK